MVPCAGDDFVTQVPDCPCRAPLHDGASLVPFSVRFGRPMNAGRHSRSRGARMNMAWMALAGMAAGLGMVFGGAVAWQLCERRAARRQRRLAAAEREKHQAGTERLRAANVRLQAALDEEKQALQGRLSIAAAEHRAALARAEGQLQFAYAEIDRLQAAGRRVDPPGPAHVHGFAMTLPFTR